MSYSNHNDYELLYLIKEGSFQAKKALIRKYNHLIGKLYKNFQLSKYIDYSDYFQNCFILLNKGIEMFNRERKTSFYSYMHLILTRYIYRLKRNKNEFLTETPIDYQKAFIELNKYPYYILLKTIKQEFENDDILIKNILDECLLNNLSIKAFADKYNCKYAEIYYHLKKIKQRLRILLTKEFI